MAFASELQAALDAVSLATACILDHYRDFVAIPNARVDISTQADRDSQELIFQHLRRHFPADALCGEEQTPTLASAPHTGSRVWVVDPIDGTRGFAQKNGEFSVLVALLENGLPVVGVAAEPALSRLTYAVRGGGCWKRDGDGQPTRCQVTTQADLSRAVLVQSRSKPGEVTRQVTALEPGRVDETHSAGVKLARVARGEADLFVNHYFNFHDWDVCAGHLLVLEAGGQVCGLRGQQLRYGETGWKQAQGMLASNGVLHEAALAKLREVF